MNAPTTRVPSTWTKAATVGTDYTFHQIAPYIGRMKTAMARSLVLECTKPGDVVVDPFAGSGVVPLEAAANGRNIVAGDWNPYAALLMRAKLFPPKTEAAALKRLDRVWAESRSLVKQQDLRRVPQWVRRFFHSETLKNTLAFRDACVAAEDHFLLACLLGILHHQRPGFLSFPSSHLVPYLRDRKFPRLRFPDLYAERDVYTRMRRKIVRTYRRPAPVYSVQRTVLVSDARAFPRIGSIGAVITSPPYMNELDYVRDNRLRLWLIGRGLPAGLELSGEDRENAFERLIDGVISRLAPDVVDAGYIVLVVGDATRGTGRRGRTAAITQSIFANNPALSQFELVARYRDSIPDVRRSRRECRGTKSEVILVYQKNG